jgi:hypothetical protein
MAVHHGAAVLEQGLVLVFLDRLAFLIGFHFAHNILIFQMGPNGRKVALFKLLERASCREWPESLQKIRDEDLGRGRMAQMHAVRIVGGQKLSPIPYFPASASRVIHRTAAARLVLFRKGHPGVCRGHPLTVGGRIDGVSPEKNLHHVRLSFGPVRSSFSSSRCCC